MIAYPRGTILQKGQNFAIVVADNVGYQVFIHANLLAELKLSEPVSCPETI